MIPLDEGYGLEPFDVYLDRYGHRAPDFYRRDQNKAAGREFCGRCEGTGNELFSMYQECEECEGRGYHH